MCVIFMAVAPRADRRYSAIQPTSKPRQSRGLATGLSNMGPFHACFVRSLTALVLVCASLAPLTANATDAGTKKIVLIAGTVHQGPQGHPAGTHEYELAS